VGLAEPLRWACLVELTTLCSVPLFSGLPPQLFNEFNARSIENKVNVWKGVFTNAILYVRLPYHLGVLLPPCLMSPSHLSLTFCMTPLCAPLPLPRSMVIIFITIGLQIMIVEVGGRFTSTTGLQLREWGWSVLMGFGSVPVGILMRFIPVKEDERSFAVFYSDTNVLADRERSPRTSGGAASGGDRSHRGTTATTKVVEVGLV
jgi:hypothetical protein